MTEYLFNGVELPALPEWDKTAYPYVVIYKEVGGWYALEMFTEQPIAYSDGENYLVCGVPGGCGALYWGTVSSTDREWGDNAYATYDSYDGREIQFLDGTKYLYSLFWSNSDILKEDGTLYLAASEPIPILAPVIDPLSMWLGHQAGQWVVMQRGKKKPPVAYLYNEVRLPGLPEWDKVNNPCAAIMRIEVDGTAHALLAVAQYADSRFAIRNNKNGDPIVTAKVSGYYVGINSFNCIAMFYAPLSGGEWVATTESFSCNAEDLIWSNFDVADARTDEETVFLAASDPIPVYE